MGYDDTAVPTYADLLRLDGRRFLVLGAGAGTGRQTCHALAQAGATVACLDRNPDRVEELAAAIGGHAIVGDASDRTQAERIVDDAAAALGGIDGLVDIVGAAHFANLLDMDDADYDRQMDACFRHVFDYGRLVGQRMVDGGGGTMVFISSLAGFTAAPRHSVYGAAKAAMMSFAKSLASELGPSGVRVNVVAPGAVSTPRMSVAIGEAGRQREIARSPIRTIGLPSDVAASVLFLSCDMSRYVTGHTLIVDGGVLAKYPFDDFDL